MSKRAVVVVTSLMDVTADGVIEQLRRRSVPVVRFDVAELGRGLTVSTRLGSSGLAGGLTTPTRALGLGAIRSLYWRRPSAVTYPELSPQDAVFAKAQAVDGLKSFVRNLEDCFYVSHPAAIQAAEDKAAQLLAATELGMRVPDTLMTNSLEDARAFAAEHRDQVIYKPIRHTDYEVNGEPVTIWTKPVTAAELDESVRVTMHLFQEKINKVADWRITVIGDDIFAVQIDAPADLLDWRYDYDALSYTTVDLPPQLTDQLHAYVKRFGLAYGSFDFGITAEGEPVFFECNPNGQFAWLEEPTGLPMTAAVADLLSKGTA